MPPQYRYYCLDNTGMIHSAEWFDAPSDEEALAHVEAKHGDSTCEVWQGARLVGKIVAQRMSA